MRDSTDEGTDGSKTLDAIDDERRRLDDASPSTAPGRQRLHRFLVGLLRGVWWIPIFALMLNDRPYGLEMIAITAPLIALAIGMMAIGLRSINRSRLALEGALCGAALFGLCWFASLRYSASSESTEAGERLRVMTYNAFGQRSASDDRFFDWLRRQNPDLVCIIDPPLESLQRRTWIRERYPFQLVPEPGLEWEIVLLSKRPFHITPIATYSRRVAFSFPAIRSVRLKLDNGSTVLFTAMHPPSPRKAEVVQRSITSVTLDGEVLANWLREHNDFAIVAGDFNSPPTGQVFQTFAKTSGLRTWTSLLCRGTWPAWMPSWASFPIDRLWVSPQVRIRSAKVGPQFASDHRPIVAELDIPPFTAPSKADAVISSAGPR